MRGLSAITVLAVVLGAFFGSMIVEAAEWHVAPDGKAAADGSRENPWDLQTALKQPATVRPGDTIWLHGGTYTGLFASSLKGTEKDPIIVRQALGERAILDSGEQKGHILMLTKEGSDTWYWGFEVVSSPKDDPASRSWGVWCLAPRAKLINLIVHDTALGFGHWAESPDSEMYGCLSYLNGYSNLQHGLYVQNEKGGKLIAENIIFGNASYGIHGYATKGFLNNMTLEGNVSFNNGGLYRPDFGCNIQVGASEEVAQKPTLISNYTYFSPEVPGSKGTNNMGYAAGSKDLTLKDNYFVTPADRALILVKCENVTMTGNTFHGRLINFTETDYPKNTFYGADKKPKGVEVFVRPNKYETGRAHVIIYNWDMKDTVSVDLTPSGLKAGDDYEIRDVQNFLGKPVFAGKYDGKPVELPMAGLTYAQPIAKVQFPPVHTSKEFNVFVVLKTTGN